MIAWNEMLSRVRRQAKDEGSALFADETLKGLVLDAARDLGRARPEALLSRNGLRRSIPAEWPEDPTEGMPVDDFYEEALVALVLSKLHLRDAQDAKDESLGAYWERRYRELIGG